MHVIKLDGYNATTENGEKLELGTFDSFGEEQLQIVKAPDWVNLSVIATFNPPNRKPVQAVVDSVTGVIKVPKEATAGWYGVGTIVFVGLADGVQRISSDVEYIVRRHSNASGTEPAEPTPDLLQQVFDLSRDAQIAAKNAEDVANSVREDADNGKFIGPVGPEGPVGPQGAQGIKGEKGDTGESRYFMYCVPTSLLPDISAGHEVASLKAYIAAQNAAGTPVQIAYKLATPTPFTATGAQPIPALAGANTILTDADSATVTGRADPIKRITDLEEAVASQT